jgi:tryptophan synthase alpha chain
MPYATAGFPDEEGCLAILRSYRDAGADIVELGVPFSDPLADGPVIQASSQLALRQGLTLDVVLRLTEEAAAMGVRPVLLSYLNSILARGPERFFRQAAASGVLGVVVPDLPVEEAVEVREAARAAGVDLVLLAVPTSPEERLQRIAAAASGFVYCVSATGVTGVRQELSPELPAFLERLRARTSLPLAVGFGVSTPEQAGRIAAIADGVIIGSRLVAMVQQSDSVARARQEIERFLRDCRAEMGRAIRPDSG